MPTIIFITDLDRSFFNFVVENKPRLKETSNSPALDAINSELYRRIMVGDTTDTDNAILASLKNDFMQVYEEETALVTKTFVEEATQFIKEFELFKKAHTSQLEKFYSTLHSFLDLKNSIYSVEVLLSSVAQSTNEYVFKKLPSSFSGRNSKPACVLFPLDLFAHDFNTRTRMLFHELSHVADYQHTSVTEPKSKLYRLAEEKVEYVRSKIPLATRMRDVDIIKILYEVIVNTLAHTRFSIFQEIVLNDTELHGDRDWIERFKFHPAIHKVGDLQMVAAWKTLPYTREYVQAGREVDSELFDIVAKNICDSVS